jgi:hypothetical protein
LEAGIATSSEPGRQRHDVDGRRRWLCDLVKPMVAGKSVILGRARVLCGKKELSSERTHVLARGFVRPDCFTGNNGRNLMRSINFRGF